MRENVLKTKLKNGGTAFGLLTPGADPSVVEILGRLGYECYAIDCEHGPSGPAEVGDVVRACEGVGMTPLARIRSTDPKLILQFLDLGVMGVIMPGIKDADDVKRLVEAVKYPPLGKRGIAAVRANDYLLDTMSQEEYIPFSNEQTLVLPQVELMEAVKNLDSLLRVEGVDGFIVGPRDLSMSMGFYDGPAHAELVSVRNHVFDTVRAAGLVVGTVASTGDEARSLVEHGASIILTSVIGLLKVGSAHFFSGVRG